MRRWLSEREDPRWLRILGELLLPVALLAAATMYSSSEQREARRLESSNQDRTTRSDVATGITTSTARLLAQGNNLASGRVDREGMLDARGINAVVQARLSSALLDWSVDFRSTRGLIRANYGADTALATAWDEFGSVGDALLFLSVNPAPKLRADYLKAVQGSLTRSAGCPSPPLPRTVAVLKRPHGTYDPEFTDAYDAVTEHIECRMLAVATLALKTPTLRAVRA